MRVFAPVLLIGLVLLGPGASASRAACPSVPGDVAPGTLENLAWTPRGDGDVTVADVVVLLRVANGLQAIAWPAPLDAACSAMPGDISPSTLDETTSPPTCTAAGDGVIDAADVAQALSNALDGCKPPAIPDDVPSDEQLAVLDDLPEGPESIAGVLLPSGQSLESFAAEHGIPLPGTGSALSQPAGGAPPPPAISTPEIACTTVPADPETCRDMIVAYMILQAEHYTQRSQWSLGSGGEDAPAQFGLAYSFGQKDPRIRSVPPCGLGDKCPGTDPPGTCVERIQGFDCSGLVYRSALAAALNIPVGTAATQSLAKTWNDVIPQSWPVRMERVADATFETGDIIGWSNHVGIVETGGTTYVLQSNGRPGPETAECEKNRGPTRGPRKLTLAGMTSEAAWGMPTSVLRLRPVSCNGEPNVCIEGHVVQCFQPACIGTTPVCFNCFSVPMDPGGCYYVEGAHQGMEGLVIGTSLDAATTMTDENGHFLLVTDTPVVPEMSNLPYSIFIDGTEHGPYGWGAHPTGQLFTVGDFPECTGP